MKANSEIIAQAVNLNIHHIFGLNFDLLAML